jgi:hypothetical protein
MIFSKQAAELTARISELETTNASITEQLATITTERDAHAARITEMETSHATAIEQLQAAHESALTAARTEAEAHVDTRIATAVNDALASAGIPDSQLPARGSAENNEASVEDLREQLSAESDPIKAGKIVAKIKSIQAKSNKSN